MTHHSPPPLLFLSPFFKTFVAHPPKINELDTVVTRLLSSDRDTPKISNVHMSMTYQILTTDKTRNSSSLMTLLYGLLVKMCNLQQNFCVGTYENWQSGAKWRINLNSEKTKVIIFSRSPLSRKSEPILKVYGEKLKIYPQVKILGITFDSKLTFQKHFQEILGRCSNTRYHRVRLIVNKKWRPSPSTLLQIYKQCARPIFEYGPLLTITTSDTIISKIQRLQNKFIRLALHLPKYISVKLLHDSSGLPYVKFLNLHGVR